MYKRTEANKNKKSFMQELDEWSEENILHPLHEVWHAYYGADSSEEAEETTKQAGLREQEVKKAIREKVLESYHNGLKAKATRERKDWR